PIQKVDVLDPVAPLGVYDLRLAREQPAVRVERDEVGVGAVGDVLDESGRQSKERAIVVDRRVEAPVVQEKRAGEHEVAETAIVEIERLVRGLQVGSETLETECHRCAGSASDGTRQPADLLFQITARVAAGSGLDTPEHPKCSLARTVFGKAQIQ